MLVHLHLVQEGTSVSVFTSLHTPIRVTSMHGALRSDHWCILWMLLSVAGSSRVRQPKRSLYKRWLEGVLGPFPSAVANAHTQGAVGDCYNLSVLHFAKYQQAFSAPGMQVSLQVQNALLWNQIWSPPSLGTALPCWSRLQLLGSLNGISVFPCLILLISQLLCLQVPPCEFCCASQSWW